MRTLAIDIETYSDVSLPDCGVHKYVSSEQFEILLFAYSADDEDTRIIDMASGEELPDEVMDALKDDSVIKTAYNAVFERICISKYFGLSLKPEAWRCTLVQASMLSLPLSLEGVGEALHLDKKKMGEGNELIRYFCMPCKATKTNGGRTRNLPSDAPDKWELFKTYCIRDVDVEKQIRKKLEKYPIPDREQELYCMDQRINDRALWWIPDLWKKPLPVTFYTKRQQRREPMNCQDLRIQTVYRSLRAGLRKKGLKWIPLQKRPWRNWWIRRTGM